MNNVWKKVWPKCVYGFVGLGTDGTEVMLPVERLHQEITTLVQDTGFRDVDEENVEELLISQGKDFSNEDLIELEQQKSTTTRR